MLTHTNELVALLADLNEGADVECAITLYEDFSWRITRNADGEILADGENIYLDVRDEIARARVFDTITDRHNSKPVE